MKIILSRKGFDSAFGGYPSPILPDGTLISLPVPSKEDSDTYVDLKLNKQDTYFDLMKQLNPKIRLHKQWFNLTKYTNCHRDPDIYPNVIKRLKNWKSCFGQMNQAQTHLHNQGVKENDIFLFFGWFKQTEFKNGILQFKKSAPDLHIIFGYLQIGEIIQINEKTRIPDWMQDHPHAKNKERRKNPNNTIYVARKNSSWDRNKPGANTLKFNQNLVLTKNGFSRTRWDLPKFFRELEISCHSKNSWKNNYLQSAMIGQEFVIEENKKVEDWAKRLIKNN